MVVQGGFSLHLIDAATQQPLNEYRGPSGAVYYAEAKPDGEYFLRFQVLREEEEAKAVDSDSKTTAVDKTSGMMFYFRPSVDGKDLGFYTNLTKSDGARDVGLWTYINGIGTNQALKFEAAAVNNSIKDTPAGGASTSTVATGTAEGGAPTSEVAPSKTAPPLLHMGNVQVQISKAVFTGTQKRVYSVIPALTQEETVVAEAAVPVSASSSLHEDDQAGAANGDKEEEKTTSSPSNETSKTEEAPRASEPVAVLRSREGKARFAQEFTEECPTYKPGELLETITIHYGSTAALIQAGVLLPAGTVPQYVAVSPRPPATPTSSKAETTDAAKVTPVSKKGLVSSPLLDASTSSTEPTGTKRLHVSDEKKEEDEGVKPPATKKPCLEVAAPEPTAAPVVSSK